MKAIFPAAYGETCILVPIDIALVPIISGHLKYFEERRAWLTNSDFEQGYNAIAELRANMTNNCVQQITDSIDKLYRLLDTTYNGTQYTSSTNPETGEITVSPAIPAVPPASTSEQNAMRAHIGRLWLLAENAARGGQLAAGAGIEGAPAITDDESIRDTMRALQGLTGGFFGIGATPVTMADLLKAGRVNTTADQGLINDGVEEIIQTLGSGGSVATVISNILGAGADVASDGGVIAATIAASIANAAAQALLIDKLQRMIAALDGGALLPPEDNILRALRGEAPATAERNVASLLE